VGLAEGELSAPVRYAELARRLGVEVGERAPLAAVRETVLTLRRGKGMVLDAADPDSRSAGSFFTNPLLEEPRRRRCASGSGRGWATTSAHRSGRTGTAA
jgi:UDP-N-acetylmuramate dehydrogenase